MIHCEENLNSPQIVRGESPSIQQTIHVFTDGEELSEKRAYLCACEYFRKYDPLDNFTSLAQTLRLKTISTEITGPNQYQFVASYNAWKPKTIQYSRNSGGKTARIKFGSVITWGGVDDKPPINYGGGIGFSNGVFEGVDVPVPGSNFTITAAYPFAFYTPQYERILNSYRGCVNSSNFSIYAPGEVMFLDANVTKEEETNPNTGDPRYFWRIAFAFEASPNVTGLTNNDTLNPINKYGHDAYWIDTVTATDPEANRMTRKPVGHYTVRPWTMQWVNFSVLWVPDYRLQYGERMRYL
ncbi:MAG: hypothetical protein Q4E67_02465 [Planctomycetia bacterium]|nr:hypothetical protein [Planctomycetia bacterium]